MITRQFINGLIHWNCKRHFSNFKCSSWKGGIFLAFDCETSNVSLFAFIIRIWMYWLKRIWNNVWLNKVLMPIRLPIMWLKRFLEESQFWPLWVLIPNLSGLSYGLEPSFFCWPLFGGSDLYLSMSFPMIAIDFVITLNVWTDMVD